jgi:hypothetical protein
LNGSTTELELGDAVASAGRVVEIAERRKVLRERYAQRLKTVS